MCTFLGGTSLLTALHLASIKGLAAASMKYVLAAVSIEAIANSFMIVLNPSEFLVTFQDLHSVKVVVSLLLFWVLIYEANIIFKQPKVLNFLRKKPLVAH